MTDREAIEKFFPRNGPCALHPRTLLARHRIIATIKFRHGVGESIASIAIDYDLPRRAIMAALRCKPWWNRLNRNERWIAGHLE